MLGFLAIGNVAKQGHYQHGKEHQAKQAHARDLAGLSLLARQLEGGGQGQHQGHACNGKDLSPAVELGARVVARGQLRAPGEMGDGQHGIGGVKHEEPEGEIERAGRRGHVGKKHLPNRKAQKRDGKGHPMLPPAPAALVAINGHAHKRVGHHVEEPGDGKDQAHGSQRQAHHLRIEARQVDGNGHAHGGHGHGDGRVAYEQATAPGGGP